MILKARIRRESFGQWWLEVYSERCACDPPSPFRTFSNPPFGDGWVEICLHLTGSRRIALRRLRRLTDMLNARVAELTYSEGRR